MSSQQMESWFTEAAAIASKLPKNLQEAAFNRALDHLMKSGAAKTSAPSSKRQRVAGTDSAGGSGGLPAIDRTKLPDIGATSRLADRALKLLQLALNEYSHDGLTAGEISEILTKTFRLPAKPNAVAMALARETTTVDLRRDGARNVFHIMQPGEDYLSSLRAGSKKPSTKEVGTRKPPSAKSARRGKQESAGGEPASVGAGKAATKKERRKKNGVTGRPGPKAAIERLIDRIYFKNPKAISDVRSELKHSLGFDFAVQELSISLVRLLREGKLKRDRNENGQYEYRV